MKSKIGIFGIITLVAIFAFTFMACEGPQGPVGSAGIDAPTIGIDDEGFWLIGGARTNPPIRAQVQQPSIDDEGFWTIGGVRTNPPVQAQGDPGAEPEINYYGYWVIGGVVTYNRATWIQPRIENGHWYIGEQRVGQATGEPGRDAVVHYVTDIVIQGGRTESYNGETTLTMVIGDVVVIGASAIPYNALVQTMLWDTEDSDIVGIRRYTPGRSVIWTSPESSVQLTALAVGEAEIFVTAMGTGVREVTRTLTVTVLAAAPPPPPGFDYHADIVVVGLGAAGTMAALAPAQVWPGVRVIALESDYQTQNAVARSMGGGHGDAITPNAGGRINFGPHGPRFNADGTVSVTWGNFGVGSPLGFTTIGANPIVNREAQGLGSRARFVETAGILPRDGAAGRHPTLREVVAHSNWMRTALFVELGIFDAVGTGMSFPASGFAAPAGGGLGGQYRFDRIFLDDVGAASHQRHAEHIYAMFRTRGEELIFDGDEIVGVLARRLDTGATIRIAADKVILATGHFLRDPSLVADYFDIWTDHPNLYAFAEAGWLASGGARFNDGFGHRMARSAGADPYPEANFGFSNAYMCESFMWRLPSGPANDQQGVFMQRHFMTPAPFQMQGAGPGAPPGQALAAGASGGLLLVDGLGRRFMNETGAWNYGWGGAAIGTAMMNHGPYFPFHIIVSSDANPALRWNQPITWNFNGPRTAHIMEALNAAANLGPVTPISGVTDGDRSHLQVVRGDTLAELAVAMGLTGDAIYTFVATVNAYQTGITADEPADPRWPARPANLRVRQFNDGLGVACDCDYYDDPDDCVSVPGDGPFFAVRLYPASAMGHAGVAANWRGRALTTWDDPDSYIANLYAVGEMSFRGLYQPDYVAGSGIGWSMARGMIAGMDAAFRLRWGVDVPSLQRP